MVESLEQESSRLSSLDSIGSQRLGIAHQEVARAARGVVRVGNLSALGTGSEVDRLGVSYRMWATPASATGDATCHPLAQPTTATIVAVTTALAAPVVALATAARLLLFPLAEEGTEQAALGFAASAATVATGVATFVATTFRVTAGGLTALVIRTILQVIISESVEEAVGLLDVTIRLDRRVVVNGIHPGVWSGCVCEIVVRVGFREQKPAGVCAASGSHREDGNREHEAFHQISP